MVSLLTVFKGLVDTKTTKSVGQLSQTCHKWVTSQSPPHSSQCWQWAVHLLYCHQNISNSRCRVTQRPCQEANCRPHENKQGTSCKCFKSKRDCTRSHSTRVNEMLNSCIHTSAKKLNYNRTFFFLKRHWTRKCKVWELRNSKHTDSCNDKGSALLKQYIFLFLWVQQNHSPVVWCLRPLGCCCS